jgi:hypothetical protein
VVANARLPTYNFLLMVFHRALSARESVPGRGRRTLEAEAAIPPDWTQSVSVYGFPAAGRD